MKINQEFKSDVIQHQINPYLSEVKQHIQYVIKFQKEKRVSISPTPLLNQVQSLNQFII